MIRSGAMGSKVLVTEAGLVQIEADAQAGLSLMTIAARLGVERHCLLAIRQRQPEVEEAIHRGRGKLEDTVVHRLLDIGMSNNPGAVTALVWLSKNRLGWRDSGLPDGAQIVSNIQINMTTPDLRQRVSELLVERGRLLGEGGGDGEQGQ